MRKNVRFMRVSWFFQQFYLIIRHKPEKMHIIPNALNKLASANHAGHDNLYSKLDALFIYYATLVEISHKLIKSILNGYLANNW